MQWQELTMTECVEEIQKKLEKAHLGFAAQSVHAVNPDILGKDMTPLIEFHILGQLLRQRSQSAGQQSGELGKAHIRRVGNNS